METETIVKNFSLEQIEMTIDRMEKSVDLNKRAINSLHVSNDIKNSSIDIMLNVQIKLAKYYKARIIKMD